MDLLDDIDDGPPPDPVMSRTPKTGSEAIEKAVRYAELELMKAEATARAAGWKLVCHCGTGVLVWQRQDGKYIADYPHKRIEL